MILVKTEAGNQVLKDRSVRISPRQRSAFILCDGKRSLAEVLAAGMGIVQGDIDQLIALGLLGPAGAATVNGAVPAADAPAADRTAGIATTTPKIEAPKPSPSDAPAAAPTTASAILAASTGSASAAVAAAPQPPRSAQQRYQDAYPIATQLTASLGLRGFRLNLSVESAGRYEDLVALAPKIRAAVGPERAQPLDRALGL